MRVSESRFPPTILGAETGYHFPQAPGVLLRGVDKSALIDSIYEYRVRHGGALDTIEREIDDYYCGRWPSACVMEPSDYGVPDPAPRAAPKESLRNRVSRWAAALAGAMPRGGYSLVTTDEAARRAAICSGCSKNANWRTGCRGCSGSAAALLMQLRGLRKGNGSAYGCTVANWDCNSAASLPVDALPLSDDQLAQMPDACWRKRL